MAADILSSGLLYLCHLLSNVQHETIMVIVQSLIQLMNNVIVFEIKIPINIQIEEGI